MINILLIGSGAWGQKYISTLSNFSDVSLTIANRNNWKQLIDKHPSGVIVCTPPDSHVEIASCALSNNIPTMIEKPLSLSLEECYKLKQFSAPILVNHIHLFSQAYQNLRTIVKTYKIDKILSLGYNNGPVRNYSSLWDYGPHDLSMILDLSHSRGGPCVFPNNIDVQKLHTDTGVLFNIKIKFNTMFDAESLVGNGGKKSVRKLKVFCDGLKIEYNDKDRPVHHSPPLTNAINVFIDAIGGKKDYRLGLDLSLKIMNVLECCQKSLMTHNM
jgi:hypothetical protein